MPWQKLTPEIPNAPARAFVPTFIREPPLPSSKKHPVLNLQFCFDLGPRP